jgi:SOS-response transcriptional repressor LexA
LRTQTWVNSQGRELPITSKESGSRIRKLRKRLDLSQEELGKILGSSTMAISRWERGTNPPPSALIQLGILGKQTDCWYFWGLAGLTAHDVMQVLPQTMADAAPRDVPLIERVSAGANKKQRGVASALVAIPVLPLTAAATREKGSSHHELDWAVPENLIAAPTQWCPNPAQTFCLRVKGDSMQPLLHDGYILVVDRKQNSVEALEGQMVVAHHQRLGMVVSRLFKLQGNRLLIPDNRAHDAVPFGAGWRIIGRVLWWMGVPRREVEKPV